MFIEHSMKEYDDTGFWMCPHCGAVTETLKANYGPEDEVECRECGDSAAPRQHPATWKDFWDYCNTLKT